MTGSSKDFARFAPVTGQAAPTSIAIPVPLSATPLFVAHVRIKAWRGLTRAVNTGVVFLQGLTANDDTQGFPLAVGETVELSAGPDGVIDLSKIFVDSVTLLDGVSFVGVRPLGFDA